MLLREAIAPFSERSSHESLPGHIAEGSVSHGKRMKLFRLLFAGLVLGISLVRGAESETMADRTLKQIVERQQALFAEAAKAKENEFDQQTFRAKVQDISRSFERLLQENPKFAAGYAAYGALLGKVDMRKESAAMLLKANQLDPDMPFVKNQLGNYLAEEGKPLEAVNYFLAAIKLMPNEPLY
ncbi:MAG: hypothetical protein ABIO94_06775, partial [Opitutaceae bacterium]